jgi:D-alanyl-lipoteichoic acid acyltransferase DltB (MBOAT superfamily)/acyl carrier protein
MQSKFELLLSGARTRLVVLALVCTVIVILHGAGIVRLVTWTQSILSAEQRPVLFAGFVLTAVALAYARNHRRIILILASLGAIASFSFIFMALSLVFFWAHYNVVFAKIHRHLKLAFLLGTYVAWGLACDALLWPSWLKAHPSVLVFGYVFAVTYTFRLFYFHHEMKLRDFERVPFSSYFLYMAFAPYFMILPYMVAIPRYRDFSKCIDKSDEDAEIKGVGLLILGVLYACLWHLIVLVFDPRGSFVDYASASRWGTLAGLALLYAPYTFFAIVGDALILIGLINVLGFKLHPPFKRPLAATSVLEWWRRWNTHFRDFLVDIFYYPLVVRWRTRNRYLTIVTGSFLVFVVGSTFFHWTAKYYFTYADHSRLMWGVAGENLFMFVFVAVGLCLEQRRIQRRIPRPRLTRLRRLFCIARTWAVLAVAVVVIGRGLEHKLNVAPRLNNHNTQEQHLQMENSIMHQQRIRKAIRDFVAEIAATPLGDDNLDLVESGVIDSIRVLDLINYVAEQYAVTVTERDIYDGRFASIASIATFVADKRL